MKSLFRKFLSVSIACLLALTINAQGQTIKTKDLEIKLVTDFSWVYDDRGTGQDTDLSIYKPLPPSGFHILGYYAQAAHKHPGVIGIAIRGITPGAIAYPVDYKWIWSDAGSGGDYNCTVYEPIPPNGYLALGNVISNNGSKPSLTEVVCIRRDLVVGAGGIGKKLWNDAGSGGDHDGSAWVIKPPNVPSDSKMAYLTSGSFAFAKSHTKPKVSNIAYAIAVEMPTSKMLVPQRLPILNSNRRPESQTSPMLSSISYLPCISIKDPSYANNVVKQVNETPIYTLERYDYYQLQDFNTSSDDEDGEMGFEYSYGMEASREQSMEKTFGVSTTVEAGVEAGAYSASISVTMSFGVSHSETISTTKSESTTFSKNFRVPAHGAGALYSLSHIYILKDGFGKQVDRWTLDTKYGHFTAFPIKKQEKPNYDKVEYFNDNTNRWRLADNSFTSTAISSGHFNFTSKTKEGNLTSEFLYNLKQDKNFTMSAKIQHVSGVDNYGYGIYFAGHTGEAFYDQKLLITANGHYYINTGRDEGKFVKSPHLYTGNSSYNNIQIEKIGNIIKFYLNGHFVKKIEFNKYNVHRLGFTMSDIQTISVDELRVEYH